MMGLGICGWGLIGNADAVPANGVDPAPQFMESAIQASV
jgi:hypothetical protein